MRFGYEILNAADGRIIAEGEQTDQQLAARSAECAEMLDRVLKTRSLSEQPSPSSITIS